MPASCASDPDLHEVVSASPSVPGDDGRTIGGVRFLFTTQPGTGHLHPLLPIARGLRDRGHEVAIASSASLAAEVTAAGLAHHAIGRPWLTSQMPQAFPEIVAIPPGPARYAWARRSIFARDTTLDVVDDLVRLGTSWRADVIVRDAAEYGGYIAAELLGIPHAVVRTDSGSSSHTDRHHVADVLDDVRRHYGLPGDPGADRLFHHLVLSFAPPGLDDAELAPTCVQLRPAPADRRATAPPWFAEICDRGPVVYATLGTVYNSAELLTAVITALAHEPLELVVTTGGRELVGPFPPNVHVEAWIAQDAILPHCSAVVTHGGYGTVSAALGHGVAMVFLPISADQPMNAARLTAAGVGITLPPDGREPHQIRDATCRILEQPCYRQRAMRLAREGADRPGLPHALDLLEGLARTTACQAR